MVLRSHIVVATLLFACTASHVRADPVTVFSNFGPNDSFQTDSGAGWAINGSLFRTEQQAISQLFTPATSSFLDRVQLGLTLLQGPGAFDVFLQADRDGLPGAVLEVMHVRGFQFGTAVVSVESFFHPMLVADNPYWLSVFAGAPQVNGGWNWNSIGDVFDGRNFAGNTTEGGSPEGPWGLGPGPISGPQFRSVFRIEALSQPAPVSEPVSLLLVGSGAAIGWSVKWRRKGESPAACGYRTLAQ
jgi:hypothetical protein